MTLIDVLIDLSSGVILHDKYQFLISKVYQLIIIVYIKLKYNYELPSGSKHSLRSNISNLCTLKASLEAYNVHGYVRTCNFLNPDHKFDDQILRRFRSLHKSLSTLLVPARTNTRSCQIWILHAFTKVCMGTIWIKWPLATWKVPANCFLNSSNFIQRHWRVYVSHNT